MDLEKLKQVLIEAMLSVRENTAKNFGIAKALEDKNPEETGGDNHAGNTALTEIDLENQETILQHLHKSFPDIEISTEERTSNPTPVQAEFYKNDGKSDYLVQLDPIDGTYCYKEGLRPDYGIIASALKRTSEKEGEFVLAVMYYPSLDFFIIADEKEIYRLDDSKKTKLEKNSISSPDKPYSATFVHDKKRLQQKEENFDRDIYSINQMVLELTEGKISGFLTSNGHLNDHLVGPWMAKQWGADVEYASGEQFGKIAFGDEITPKGRMPRRDTKGLLIVGDKKDKFWKTYKQ